MPDSVSTTKNRFVNSGIFLFCVLLVSGCSFAAKERNRVFPKNPNGRYVANAVIFMELGYDRLDMQLEQHGETVQGHAYFRNRRGMFEYPVSGRFNAPRLDLVIGTGTDIMQFEGAYTNDWSELDGRLILSDREDYAIIFRRR